MKNFTLMIVALLLLGTTIVFNSCSQDNELVENSTNDESFAYSKSVTITDASGLNSVDLIISSNDRSILDVYNSESFTLETFKSKEAALSDKEDQNSGEAISDGEDTIDDSEDEASVPAYIKFENENFQTDVVVHKISLVKSDIDDSRQEWQYVIYDKTNDYCDITRSKWFNRVFYKYQYYTGEYWNYGIYDYTKIDWGSTVKIEAKGTERIRVYIKYRYSGNYSVYFYD